jgi:hypothetical protein
LLLGFKREGLLFEKKNEEGDEREEKRGVAIKENQSEPLKCMN